MKIHVTLSRDELLDAMDAVEKHISPRARVQVSTWEGILLWIPVGLALAYVLGVHGGRAASAMLGAIVFLVTGTNFFASRGKRRLNDYLVQDLSSRDVEFEFLDTHINVHTPHSSGKSEWSLIKGAVETENFVLLFIDNSQAYVVPKRIPESRSIYELANSKLGGGAC